MGRDQGEQYAMSLRLSRVLGDIGINKKMVSLRRRTWLLIEKQFTITFTAFHNKIQTFFNFGSQSEGTTTIGMKSDVDLLRLDVNNPVLLDMSEWEPGKESLCVIKNEHTPPQHCNLQLLETDISQSVKEILMDRRIDLEVDMAGRVLLKNTVGESSMKKRWGDDYNKQGPSRTMNKDLDIVMSFPCTHFPEECLFLFNRPRPGHYPRPEILSQARQTTAFIIPQGHAESSRPQLEWRFSTSLIERLLMFDLDINQIKVYTFLKIIRITYFKPVFGDRLSTFHFKTALMFTLETYPSSIWNKNNLLQCVIYCLTTLRRWCRIAYCPHYTISDVNLFLGKLSKFEMDHISSMLSDMIENILDFVVNIKMDDISKRMLELTGLELSQVQTKTRFRGNTLDILKACLNNLLDSLYTLFVFKIASATVEAEGLLIEYDNVLKMYATFMQEGIDSFRDVSGLIVKLISSTSASVQISMHIQSCQPISQGIYNMYQANLDSDLSSSRLKFASMLYCTGQYEEAATMLDHTDGLLHHPDVWQFCLSPERVQFEPTYNFLCKALDQPVSEVVRSSVALSVIFLRQELRCVPKHLVYEMYRTFTHEDILRRRKWCDDFMNLATIDSFPFLYYLQYLTYKQLGNNVRKVIAMVNLSFCLQKESKAPGYKETTTNLMAHCMELENRLDTAWRLYAKSLQAFPNNNAAVWHMAIILNKTVNQ
ncbi:uncharacterized protein LOC128207441 isoform X2 [Mya arenaria]|nr:uncharacterized protein LOC128207441 isoform X2 [Mya arenaria]XP_052766323.1 uncharacterized protein LOC128207441 isoform X2 [Mya arenaria]XP_052766324.1 uncharacterized protein LOC128207441 isoform X2 [Mya arenaria]